MTLRAYIVHLKRATSRAENVRTLLANCPCEAEVMDAVDGKAMAREDLRAGYRRHLHKPAFPFALNDGEIACLLSHRAIWQRTVDLGLSGALHLEDDAAIDPVMFQLAFDLAADQIEAVGMIHFQPRTIPQTGPALEHGQGEAALYAPVPGPRRTTAILYSHWAAQRMLEATRTFDRPVDMILQMPWVTGVTPHIVQPSGLTEVSADLGGTTIQSKSRGLRATLSREIKRPFYRARLRKAALAHAKSR